MTTTIDYSDQVKQMKEVLPYLQSNEARIPALEIILGFTPTKEQRAIFLGTDVCKELLRLIPDQN